MVQTTSYGLTKANGPTVRWNALLFVGLSLSIGWGIRGNFGHEWGAAFPGALAAMAAALLSDREDWHRRVAYFAMFGAVGWFFGGSMAYMIAIGYTHSGHSPSVAYGFFCLFVIGFLWAAIGGGFTALPIFLRRERLTQFIVPLALMFLTWWAEAMLEARFIDSNPALRGRSPLDWFDVNWVQALLAMAVVLVRAAARRKIDWAERMILVMAAGWWAGFLLLTVVLRLHMIPGKSDNWAGGIGITVAFWIYLLRHRQHGVLLASLTTGIVGGLGFAGATLFKLIEIKSGAATNWHSVLEQTYGLINGLGLACAIGRVRASAPRMSDDPPVHRWTEALAVWFVLVAVSYFNLSKEVDDWIAAKTIPAVIYGLNTHTWYDLIYGIGAVTFLGLLREQLRRGLAIVPATWLGRGQMLYLALLWWMVVGNFMKAVVAFAPERIVTEGVITVNALLCTWMALTWARSAQPPQDDSSSGSPSASDIQSAATSALNPDYVQAVKRTAVVGVAAAALSTLLCWSIVRTLYGDTFAGYAGHHIRFGPNATTFKR